MQRDESGFSATEIILVIVIVFLIGIVGWMVYKGQHNNASLPSSKSTTSTSAKQPTTSASTEPAVHYLAYNQVGFILPSDWEVATPASNLEPPCGAAVTSSLPKCTDEAVLTLKGEGFVNTDHFYAEIAVFHIANDVSAQAFFNEAGLNGLNGSGSNLVINGNPAYRYAANPSPGSSEVWLYYTITKNQIGVLVYSDLFDGNHYSFSTTNNYLSYQGEVDAIAKSITIK